MASYNDKGKSLTDITKLLSNPGISATIDKIQNVTVIDGIISMFSEKYTFRSFERALEVISVAKNEYDMQIVEAALQTTISEIKEFHDRGSDYFNDEKTSLYLFTLQYIILRLGKFELQNKAKNTYTPQLVSKLKAVSTKCKELGISDDLVRSQCISTAYQQPNHKDLSNFEFIDLDRLNAFDNRLKKYMITQNTNDLYGPTPHEQLPTATQIDIILQKIIAHMERKFGFINFDLKTYRENYPVVLAEINKIFKTVDPGVVYHITKALEKHLEAKEQTVDTDRTM